MIRVLRSATVLLLVLFIAACAGKVSNTVETRAIANKGYKFSVVEVQVSDAVKSTLPKNTAFDAEVMEKKAHKRFLDNGLISESSPYKAVISVKRVFIRDGVSAAMFGFLAGEDRIIGNVQVISKGGQLKESFEVKAGNSIGGLAASIASARADWMYGKFVKLTVQVFTGVKAK